MEWFPEIGVPPNHPFIDGIFHSKPSLSHIYIYIYIHIHKYISWTFEVPFLILWIMNVQGICGYVWKSSGPRLHGLPLSLPWKHSKTNFVGAQTPIFRHTDIIFLVIYIYMYAIIIPIISQLSILSPSSMATLITILPYVPSFRTNTFSIAKRGATRWRSINIHQSLPLCMPRDELVIRSLCITLW